MKTVQTHWIAVDCSGPQLRIWIMGEDHKVLTQIQSSNPHTSLSPETLEARLLDVLAPYLSGSFSTPVMCSGLPDAPHIWPDTPYAVTPCPAQTKASRWTTHDARLNIHILPGIRQAEPTDFMSGQETVISGFLSVNQEFDGVACLMGSTTKWAQISASEIVSFASYMTRDMFDALAKSTHLPPDLTSKSFDTEAFLTALDDAISRPQAFAGRLFTLRAETLFKNTPSHTAQARLIGLLLGIELAATRPYWLGQNLAVIGGDALSEHYVTALQAQGASVMVASDDHMSRLGLCAAFDALPT